MARALGLVLLPRSGHMIDDFPRLLEQVWITAER